MARRKLTSSIAHNACALAVLFALAGGAAAQTGVYPPHAAGDYSLDQIANPNAAKNFNWGAFTLSHTFGAATGSSNLVTLQDTVNNTGSGYLLTVGTAAGSSLNPFRVLYQGGTALSVSNASGLTYAQYLNVNANGPGISMNYYRSGISLGYISPVAWTSVDPSAAADTGLSRVSAGVLGVGNGSQGDTSGTVQASGVKLANLKATTGTRYLCIDTNGNVTSSATACSGT